ncbi:SDR family oxidoreductase [Cytophagaceae bacterium ABcell3]|nr:SDR family oxidoreductase [Cytophagaceae bacterium ABcell3]
MKNKICLITGATSGIGKETALSLAALQAQVIIHGRNKKKLENTKAEIISKTGNTQTFTFQADMESLQEVKQMAYQIAEQFPRIDVLINNAGGIMNKERALTEEGFEKTFAINHLAPFALTGLLLEKLRNSTQARVINLSSTAHKYAQPDFNDIMMEKNYNAVIAYGNAKLYTLLFTKEMHRRLRRHGIDHIATYAVHPGVVKTGFALESNSVMKLLFTLGRPFLLTPEQGAQTNIFLATAPDINKLSGEYFAKKKPASVKKTYCTQENANKLWDISEKLTNVKWL